ncbi:EF-hand calcium-binding domain-containing protein 13 [Sciurus carolinensis]|uniref:EF-hand calcium-binding domain-containing protein 13 n=1 Tax=Sciurus carolinensis TaxID=30640 RepID=A0AA41SWI1_SCICA|nr:EF-hand calcium-binding domain-containing protein 13 [Sciurus carolinensis]
MHSNLSLTLYEEIPQGHFYQEELNALLKACKIFGKIRSGKIYVNDLPKVLGTLKISLSDSEMLQALKTIDIDAFQEILESFSRIKAGRVAIDEVVAVLSNMNIFVNPDTLEEVIKYSYIDSNQTVDIGDIIFVLNDLQQQYEDVFYYINFLNKHVVKFVVFMYLLVLPDAIENLRNISKERMNVSDLWNILSTLNSNLKKDEFLAALKFTTVDGDKVQFDEFTKAVKNMRDASRLDELQEIVLALDSLEGDMICGKNLEDFLRNIGIKSPKEEAEKILQSDFVSEDNMVNIKDCMRALRDTQKFSNFIALNETINKLDCMKEDYQSDKDKYSDVLENTDRLYFTDKILQKTEDDSFVEEIKEAAHILSHVDNGKIDIPNLKHALKCLNVNLTEEDVNEGLKCCDISDNKEVDLKDFLLEMNENPHFKESKEYGKVTIQEFMSKLSDTLTIPKAAGAEDKFYNIDIHKNDLTAVSDLQQNLNAIGIYLTDDKIQKTLDNTNPSDEVVHFKDFIRKLTNTDEFVECQRIEDAWNIVNSVSDGKVEVKDLLSTLKSLEKPLTEDHPNSATDGEYFSSKISCLEYMCSQKQIVFFKKDDLFKEITTLDNIRNDKMPVDELSSKLTSIGVPLSQKTFQEILRQASVDGESILKEKST